MPILPVRQNPHRIAQPTCVERHKVIAGVSGMYTDSISRPSFSWSKNLVVPSAEVSCCLTVGVEMTKARSRLSRRE